MSAQTLLIGIGAQKAGTTWLADYLRAHPDVHMPPVKEVHFFDARFRPDWCRRYEEEMLTDFQATAAGLTWRTCGDPQVVMKLTAMLLRFQMISDPSHYLRFLQWGAGARRVLCEITPDYSMLGADGFQAMRSVHPNVKLVFLLRNPADRFWSSLRFNRTHNPAFDIDANFDRLIGREDFHLLADYGRTLDAALTAFPAEAIHIEFYERLFTPDAVARLCAFAGVAPAAADFAARSNASGSAPMPDARRRAAVAAYRHVYAFAEQRFGEALPESWRRDIERFG